MPQLNLKRCLNKRHTLGALLGWDLHLMSC